MIPPEASRRIAGSLVAKWVVGHEPMTLDGWRKYLSSAVVREWNDTTKRREILSAIADEKTPASVPDPTGQDANGGYGDDSSWA